MGRHEPLPGVAVVSRHDDLGVGDVARPALEGAQPVVMLGHRLDVRIGPTDDRLETLIAEQLHRLDRAGATAGVQQYRHRIHDVASHLARIPYACVVPSGLGELFAATI